jgi:CDP-diacylglycerol--serine O-phosphatidyltransferase
MSLFQPFDPGDEERRARGRRLVQPVPVRSVLPSLVTLLALCAGLTSIRMSIEHHFQTAIVFIGVAALLDAVDGRIARLLKSMSRFGAELDSIADFVNFGVAPAIMLYVWALNELGRLGWMAVLVYVICAALRLARFNVAIDVPDKPTWQAGFFVGMPAPAGAMTVMLPAYAEFIEMPLPHGLATAPFAFVYMLAIGILMVSRLPTWSGKLIGWRIARERVAPLFVLGVLLVACLISFTWETLTVLTLAYLASLPLSWRAYRRHRRRDVVAGVSGDIRSTGAPAP